MTLHTPEGYANPEWAELAYKITHGDRLQWRGDPSLWLGLGIVTDRATGRTGHRLEVWRHTEQGEDVMLSSWHPAEAWRIPYDLCQMDPRSPGHQDLADRLDAADAAKERADDEARAEVLIEALDHAARVHVAKHEPGTKFLQLPGLNKGTPTAENPGLGGVR